MSPSRTPGRTYTAIADAAVFAETVAAFAADSTMGYSKKELSSETYKAKIFYFDADSNEKGTVSLTAEDKDQYEEMTTFLEGDIADEATNGKDHGGASHDSTDDTRSAKYSYMLVVGEVEDTFTVTITREYMLINGFETDEALAAVEAWADGVEALSTNPQ